VPDHPLRRHLAALAAAGTLLTVGCSATGSDAPPPAAAGAVEAPTEVPALHPSVDGYPEALLDVIAGDGSTHRLVVKVADTAERKAHGLMEVPAVPDGTGMWFPYGEDRTGGFWMKGTETDLSIAWVDAAGVIVAVADMEVCRADPCPTYEPGVPYRAALEVRRGWFEERGIDVGDRVLEVRTGP
jgi:uncharacterized protein